MDKALAHQIQHLERSRQMLSRVDNETLKAGRDLFDSEAALADWLSTPAHALAGKVPLAVMRTVKGRQKVASILRAISHGVYL